MFILAQTCGIIAWLLMLLSYYRKNTTKILIIQVFSIIFYLLNYLFLGAWTGLYILILELIRDYLYYKTDEDNLIFVSTIPIYIILFIMSLNDCVEMIPIAASLFEGFTLTKKKNIVVPGALIVYSMWIIYDFNVQAYSGALTDGLIIFSNLIILYKMITGYKELDEFKINSRYSMTTNTLTELNKLKKDLYAEDLLLSDSYEFKLYNKNNNYLKFIKFKNQLKGYYTSILISKDELNKILEINELKNNYEDIILNKSNKEKILLIDSIVLKEEYQNKKSIQLIIKSILKLIKINKYDNVIIIASTTFEKDIAKTLNFTSIKEFNDSSILFVENKCKVL